MTTDIILSTVTNLANIFAGITELPWATFVVENGTLTLVATSNLKEDLSPAGLQKKIFLGANHSEEILAVSKRVLTVADVTTDRAGLVEVAALLQFKKAAILPVQDERSVRGLVLVGGYDEQLTEESLLPLSNINQLASTTLIQAEKLQKSEKRIKETETLAAIAQAIKTPWHTTAFFESIYELVKRNVGAFAFAGALYDEKTSSISLPYIFEDGTARAIDSFPLGEGLTSVLK